MGKRLVCGMAVHFLFWRSGELVDCALVRVDKGQHHAEFISWDRHVSLLGEDESVRFERCAEVMAMAQCQMSRNSGSYAAWYQKRTPTRRGLTGVPNFHGNFAYVRKFQEKVKKKIPKLYRSCATAPLDLATTSTSSYDPEAATMFTKRRKKPRRGKKLSPLLTTSMRPT